MSDIPSLLREIRPWLKTIRDRAEAKHDNDGENYMDGGQYETMREVDTLIEKIDAELCRQ